MKLLFATNNQHKAQEIQDILNKDYEIISLNDIGFYDEIPETKQTLEENASEKARFIYNKFHIDCFADDTGLEVEVLSNRPGVHSARYAGPQKNSDDNIIKLLYELKYESNRKARFRTIISLIMDEEEYLFEGVVEGSIIDHKRGNSGFGYDPVFIPKGYNKTFAEMSLEEKNMISHRANAIKKLVAFLRKKNYS